MKKKLIIFDMDGTLVNSSITIANAINFVRKNLGFEPMDEEDILSKVNDHTINPAQVFYHAKAFDAKHEKWFSQYYTKNHKSELVLYQGIKSLLLTLKNKGHLLAVATNAHRNSTLKSLGHLEVLELFDGVVCHDDVTQSKPHPEMLLSLLDTLAVTAKESLFIGDGSRDAMASEKANIDYIMVDWGFSDHDDAVRSVEALKQILTKELS